MTASRNRTGSPRNRGFTLIEVLVVVAIIALLISILLPSLSAARAQARIVACATNLRTNMQGTVYYAQASNDEMPAGYAWDSSKHKILEPTQISANPWEFLHPYVTKVSAKKGQRINGATGYTLKFPFFTCPDDRGQHTTNQRETMTPDGWRDFEIALSYNSNLNTIMADPADKRKGSRKMNSMKNAGRMVVYFDGGDDGNARIASGTDSWILSDCMADFGENQCFIELRHRNGNNFAYLDTHVEFSKMNNKAPYYGLPPFPISWIPNWNPAGASAFPAWVTSWTAFGPPQRVPPSRR